MYQKIYYHGVIVLFFYKKFIVVSPMFTRWHRKKIFYSKSCFLKDFPFRIYNSKVVNTLITPLPNDKFFILFGVYSSRYDLKV